MKRSLFTVPLALLLFAAAAGAQEAAPKLPVGTWTGNVTPPGQTILPITITVTEEAEGPSMILMLGEHGTYKANAIKFTADKLEFNFTPGPVVVCVLSKAEDGSFSGDCTDEDGDAARMVVTPPKKQS